MPAIQSPRTFTEAWMNQFAPAVEKAAGADAVLTVTEAESLKSHPSFAAVARDYFEQKKVSKVSVNELCASAETHVWREADKATGGDGRISAEDSTRLPADLKADYDWLKNQP